MNTLETLEMALAAVELAQDNLRPHGDNCFLHDDGEYSRCFCGKDSLSDHLQLVIEKLDTQIELEKKAENARELGLDYEPADEPVAWIEHHKGGDNLEWENPGGKCSPLYTRPQPASSVGSFMTREQAIEFCRQTRPNIEPTEQHITATIDAYSALFGNLTPADPRPQTAAQCDHIRHTKEGTHWCALAEKPAAWVELTEQDVNDIFMNALREHKGHMNVIWMTEAKLREKNGGKA